MLKDSFSLIVILVIRHDSSDAAVLYSEYIRSNGVHVREKYITTGDIYCTEHVTCSSHNSSVQWMAAYVTQYSLWSM